MEFVVKAEPDTVQITSRATLSIQPAPMPLWARMCKLLGTQESEQTTSLLATNASSSVALTGRSVIRGVLRTERPGTAAGSRRAVLHSVLGRAEHGTALTQNGVVFRGGLVTSNIGF